MSGGVKLRVNIQLECTECKRRNYSTSKNKKNTTERLEINKYCKWDKKVTLHKETKKQFFNVSLQHAGQWLNWQSIGLQNRGLGVRVPLDLPFFLLKSKNKGDFMNLFQGIKMEYSKVQWPKKEEIVNSTLWVIVMSLVLSVYLGVFDLIASRLLKVVVSLFGG